MIYILTGLEDENKKLIAYEVAEKLAENGKALLIDSGEYFKFDLSEKLSIISAKDLESSIDSLRVMKKLVENYDRYDDIVINSPLTFMKDLYNAESRIRFSKVIYSLIGVFKKEYKPKALFVKDEQKIFPKAKKLLTGFHVPENLGLPKEDKKLLEEGVFIPEFAPYLKHISPKSFMVPVITGDDLESINTSVAVAEYNEEFAYLLNIPPYNIFLDSSNHHTKKEIILSRDISLLLNDIFPPLEYNCHFKGDFLPQYSNVLSFLK